MFELPQLSQEQWLLVVGAAILLTMAIVWLALRVKYKAQVAVLEERLTHLDSESSTARQHTDELESELEALRAESRSLETEVTRLREQVLQRRDARESESDGPHALRRRREDAAERGGPGAHEHRAPALLRGRVPARAAERPEGPVPDPT